MRYCTANSASRQWGRRFLLAGLLLLGVAAWPQTHSDDQVKCGFLYHFAHYVEWPETGGKAGAAQLRVAMVCVEEFAKTFANTVHGKTVNGRGFLVETRTATDDLTGYHVVYLDASARKHAQQVLKQLQGTGTLTVSDIRGFADWGGTVNFVTVGNRMRFELNLKAASQEHLKVNSKLIQVAARVIKE